MWRSPRCSCEGSQRCTRSRPAQRTCRPLAVGTAPGAGPLGTEKILPMAALFAGASLFLTVTLPTSVSYLIVIWKFGRSVEAGKVGFSLLQREGQQQEEGAEHAARGWKQLPAASETRDAPWPIRSSPPGRAP